MKLLSMQDVKSFEMSLYRSNLRFMKRSISSRKEQLRELKRCLKKYHKNTAIVFCATKGIAESVAEELERIYTDDVIVYHSRKKHREKEMLLGNKHIIVATSALSMGVDVRNVDLAVHYNMPMSLSDYYQMAGRAGRDGQASRSILLYNPNDYYTNQAILDGLDNKCIRHLMLERLDEMKEFCDDTKHYMVRTLLQALGDSYDNKCRYCTNCQIVHSMLVLGSTDRSALYHPQKKQDYKKLVKTVDSLLETVCVPCSVDQMKLYRVDVTANLIFGKSALVD